MKGITVEHLGWVFNIISAEEKHGRVYRKVECTVCRRIIKEETIPSHVEAHDKSENRKRDTERRKLLGMKNHKPLPGQMGLPGIGEDVK